jgi:hypothetical protein
MRLVLAAGLALFALSAQATVLDFAGDVCSANDDGSGSFVGCGNFVRINQAYGDSADVDVTFQASPGSPDSMYFWSDSYSGLTSVAFGDSGTGVPTILIVPTVGNTVTLAGFDIGSWPNTTRDSQVTVLDLATGSALVNTGTIAIPGDAPTSFSINATSSAGFSIAFGPEGYNVGIDNIAFTTAPIPEPGTWALMALGLAGVAAAARRRRPQA